MFRKLFCLLAVLAFASVGNASLVALWTFNDVTGANIGTAGAAVDGVLMGDEAFIGSLGATGWADGESTISYNGVLVLPNTGGAVDYMECGGGGTDGWAYGDAIPEGTQGTSYTLSALFRKFESGASGNLETIISKGDMDGSSASWVMGESYSSPELAIGMNPLKNWGGLAGTSGAMGSNERWHHGVVVYETTGDWASTLKVYVDTILEASTSHWYGASYKPTLMSVRVGAGTGGGTHLRAFYGLLDDIRIYDEALSASDIADLFYAAQPDIRLSLIPEPTTIALLGLGGLAILRKKR